MIAKPRFGSDSIGVRLCRSESERQQLLGKGCLVQERLVGQELTVAVLAGRAGVPLRIDIPEGTPYSFRRKYLAPPRKRALEDALLAERVRETALALAKLFAVDWAARLDFIYAPSSGRLCFLECDVAPLIGIRSAFADSLARAGLPRAEQLRLACFVRKS
jgi:D-alanine-D-alanine ligase-like ATP-grasp enzyme